jgi:murein DD-endopeptidase MepM/ murein hydrolase activator NlpD
MMFEVRVKPGETLSKVGEQFEVPELTIKRINRLEDDIKPGQILYIPVSEKALESADLRGRSRLVSSPLPASDRRLPAVSDVSTQKGRRAEVYKQYQQLSWPIEGRLGSVFGRRNGRHHKGIDILSQSGNRIRAVREGRVEFTGWKKGYGWTVLVIHDNFRTLYAHCSKIFVNKNQWVRKGQDLAVVGSSGNAEGIHLHFEYLTLKNTPLDPMPHFSRYAH